GSADRPREPHAVTTTPAPRARNARRPITPRSLSTLLVRVLAATRDVGPTLAVMSTTPPKPLGPYTPVVEAGEWIIVSGQVGTKDGALVEGGVRAQTAQAVENVRQQLATVGASLADVAKTLCFLTDMDTFATFNEAYVAGFGSHRPARSTVGVAALPAGAAVEIEAWAYKPVG